MHDLNPHRLFTCLGVLFGLLFIVVTPPFQSPDEYAHFFRAYALSEGNLAPTLHDTLPRSVVDFARNVSPDPLPGNFPNKQSKRALFAQFKQPFNEDGRVPYTDINPISYSPISYLPQALGITIGRFLKLPPILIFYLGRLTNLTVWVILVAITLQLVPLFQWFFLILALMPMSIFQAASNSPDVLVNSLSFLLIALILSLIVARQEKIPLKIFGLIGLVVLLLSAIKPVYTLIACLILVVPVKRFGSLRRFVPLICSLAVLAIGPFMIWNQIDPGGAGFSAHPASIEQVHFITHDPLAFIRFFSHSLVQSIIPMQKMFVGVLGWLDTPLPVYVYPLYLCALVLAAILCDNPATKISISTRVYSFLIFLGIVVAIYLYNFVFWTPVGAKQIEGVQGRYLIPIAPLLFFPLCAGRIRKPWWFGSAVAVFIVFILSVSLKALLWRYYAI